MGQKVSIIIPVIRPEKLEALVEKIHDNASVPSGDYEILARIDCERIGCPLMVRRLTMEAKHDLVCFLGDDTDPQPGFLAEALAAMETLPSGWGLVGLNDKTGRNLPTHWLADKRLLGLTGGEFFSTAYTHCFCDNELMDISEEAGRYVYAEKAVVLHNHALIDGSEADSDIKRAYSDEAYKKDFKTYLRRKGERYGFKLGICLPIVDNMVYRQFFASFVAMEKPDFELFLPKHTIPGFADDIAHIRNDLAYQALVAGCTHIAFMDTDQVYPENGLKKLLENDRDICGALVHRRYPPFDPVMLRGELGKYTHVGDEEMYSGRVVPVDATGTGFLLIKSEVFFALEEPWFRILREPKTVGEDIFFCSQARKAGFEIFVDTSVEAGHLALSQINRNFHFLFKKMNRFEWKGKDDGL